MTRHEIKRYLDDGGSFADLVRMHRLVRDPKIKKAFEGADLLLTLGEKEVRSYLNRVEGKGKCRGFCCASHSEALASNW